MRRFAFRTAPVANGGHRQYERRSEEEAQEAQVEARREQGHERTATARAARVSRLRAERRRERERGGALVAPALEPEPQPTSDCAPGYDPCVPPYPPDVDCPNVDGPITVTGPDPHGFDGDSDGVGSES
jgi:hypothetical protein